MEALVIVTVSALVLAVVAKYLSLTSSPSLILDKLQERVKGVIAPSFFVYEDKHFNELDEASRDQVLNSLQTNTFVFAKDLRNRTIITVLHKYSEVAPEKVASDIYFIIRRGLALSVTYKVTNFVMTNEKHMYIYEILARAGIRLCEVRVVKDAVVFTADSELF